MGGVLHPTDEEAECRRGDKSEEEEGDDDLDQGETVLLGLGSSLHQMPLGSVLCSYRSAVEALGGVAQSPHGGADQLQAVPAGRRPPLSLS